jgi:CelD/BcsL family acetyltransferase involved in cellulose biosynthesis
MSPADWSRTLGGFEDRIVFQTAEWLAFLAETQGVEPVWGALKEGDEVLGYVTGVIMKKFGLRIFASPIPGASTPYMGFNLRPGVSRRVAAAALPEFAFKQLRCAHLEVVDAFMKPEDIAGLGFQHRMNPTLEVDLTLPEEEIFNRMTKSCRWTVRKAEKNGLVIEVANDAAFAGEVAAQLREVFAKHGLALHFGEDRVKSLVKHLGPTGGLLRLRARDAQGRCLGTGIYPVLHHTAFYLIGASWREHQKLYPNELLLWQAMLHSKRAGARVFNMVGNMEFKQKFGGVETAVPLISKSRNPLIGFLRQRAPQLAKTAMRLAYRFKSRPSAPAPETKPPEA